MHRALVLHFLKTQIREKLAMAASVVKENILYVVLHGLITLIDVKEKGFLAHILEIGSDHQYLLGDWLQEAEIPEREKGRVPLRASLINIDPGTAKLNPDNNAVLKLESLPPDTSSDVRAVLRLPRPRKIHNFVVGKLPKGALAGDLKRLVQVPQQISGTQVFEYTFQDKGRVALVSDSGRALWKPKALAVITGPETSAEAPAKKLSVAVLHIYDEPGIRLPGNGLPDLEDHNRREFKLSSVFLHSDLDLVKKMAAPEDFKRDAIPEGLLPGEVTNLDERVTSVFPIVLGLRQGNASGASAGGGSSGPVCGGMQAQLI
jgi:hypothetical protein